MINIKQLKQNLKTEDIISIVESLGGTLKKQADDELIFTSICCKADADNHKPKLYYYPNSTKKYDGLSFHCYKCSETFDIISLVQHQKDCSFMNAVNYICDTIGISSGTYEHEVNPNSYNWQRDLRTYITKEQEEVELTVYDESVLNFFDKAYHQDWLDFGISEKVLDFYGIKYYNYRQQVVIPVFDEGKNLVGIRARNMNPNSDAKYIPVSLLNGESFKFPVSYIMYGIWCNEEAIRKKRILYLVEAEKSVLKLATWFGISNNPSLAMYGSNLSDYNRDYLISLGIEEVIIIPDRDFKEIGDDNYNKWVGKIEKQIKMFSAFCRVSVAWDKEMMLEYKDNICDGSKEYFDKMIEERDIID